MTTLLVPLAENPLIPNLAEIIASIVFALLLTFLIARYVVPRFEATYAERTAAIQGGMEKAEKAQEAAEAALRQYNEQLAEARTEAARIREEAKSEGTQILADLREQAHAEVARIRTQGEAQLEAERTTVMTQMRAEIGTLATTLASRPLCPETAGGAEAAPLSRATSRASSRKLLIRPPLRELRKYGQRTVLTEAQR
jgi:F-type H+-transporting ATPase subunit b